MLYGVDIEIAERDLISLLGRNGAGKTTTLRSIVGATLPQILDGSVAFQGQSLLCQESYDIADLGIAFVPEERRCFPDAPSRRTSGSRSAALRTRRHV